MQSFAEPRVGTLTMAGVLIVCMGIGAVNITAVAQNGETPPSATDRGEAALAAGREALAAGRWREAIDRFTEALSYLPNNQEAIAGRDQALTMLNQATTSEEVARTRELQRARAIAEFDESMRIAEERRRQGDYAGASQEVALALTRLDERREFLNETEYRRMRDSGLQLSSQVDREREAAELERVRTAQTAAQQAQIEQAKREQEQRRRQIEESLRRVRQLQMELKYREALQVVDEILFLDPIHPAALALRDVLETNMMYRDWRDIQREKEFSISNTIIEAHRSTRVPRPNLTGPGHKSVSGIMEYPEDWPQVSHRRGGEVGFQESPENRAVWQRLQETNVPLDFQNNTFDQIRVFLEDVTGLSIYVDWRALNNVGIDRDTEIEGLRLQNVNAATALERILDQMGEGDMRPQFDVQDGILVVSSDEAMRKRVMLLVYDIRDLLFQVPVFDNAPELDLNNALNQGQNQGGGGQGGGGGGGFGGGGGGSGGGQGGSIFGNPGADPDRPTRAELVRQIVDIIQENIDPEGWRDLGGTTGSLQELNGNLIITNTPNNHREIEGLLTQLREIRALQINVESRFLTVATNWFEKIGVDLDLYFNTNKSAFNAARAVDPNFHLSDFFDDTGRLKDPVVFGSPGQVLNPAFPHNTVNTGSYIGLPDTTALNGFQNTTYITGPVGAPIRATSGFAPIGVTQDHNNLINTLANFVSPFASAAAANPALTVGIQFLDDIQVDLLIEATQADRRSVILTAPRLTFFNGQRSWVAVTTQTAFVSSLTPVTGDAAGAFAPTIGVVADGFVLDVEGVISADRRYVTMTVLFDFTELLALETQEFQGAAGGGGIAGGGAAVFSGSISLPTLRASQVRTTVSVPDKGTVLLGGQRHVEEIEVETGVPVLSKIPFINRFFTNRATEKNEQTLLILIRPEIIIQQENEDLLFPGLSDSLGGAYLR